MVLKALRRLARETRKRPSSLAEALLRGSAREVEACLEARAPINLRPEEKNALRVAARAPRERAAKVKLLLKAGADPNLGILPSKRSPLTLACLEGDVELAAQLVLGGGDANRPDFHGVSAMRLADMRGLEQLRQAFLEAGARDERASAADIESTFLVENALWSQLHELVKTAVARASLKLAELRLRWPEGPSRSPSSGSIELGYALAGGALASGTELRLTVLSDGRITLALEQAGKARDLLRDAAAGELDATALRGVLLITLGELKTKGFVDGDRREVPRRRSPQRPLTEAERQAHQTLEVEAGATAAELRAAYYRLAKRHHPDTGPGGGSAEKMRELKAAYDRVRRLK